MSTNRRLIHATPEDVFAVLGDGWLFPSWVVGASRIRGVDDVWPAKKAKLHHSFGLWPLVIDDTTSVVDWNPPHRAQFRARGWPIGEANVTLVVRAHHSGCMVSMQEDAVQGLGRFVPKPLRELLLVIRNKEALQRLAWLAEQGAGRRAAK